MNKTPRRLMVAAQLPWLILVLLFCGVVLWQVVKANPMFGLVLGAVVIGIVLYGAKEDADDEVAQEQAQRQAEEQRLIHNADFEHERVFEGDPRGTYGNYLPPEDLR